MKANPVTHRSDGTTAIHIVYKAVPFDCIIDTEDYPKVAGYRWNVKIDDKSPTKITYRVYTGQKHLCIHRILLGFRADHKDHDGLNNRKENLRLSTHQQNCFNRRKRSGSYSSQFKGVYFHKICNKWTAKIGKTIVGYFSTEIDAALAYNAAAIAEHGEFALLNQIGG